MGTLFAFYPTTDPVKFKQSVDRICNIKNIKAILPAHNSLNISADIIQKIKDAFEAIEKDNLLIHGSGTFNFDGFSIQL
jgi:hypothetical protein